MPRVARAQDTAGAGQTVTMTLADVDIKDAIRLVVPNNAQVDPDVKGSVNISIKNQTVDGALTQILNGTPYTFDKTNGVYHVHDKVTTPAQYGYGGANPGGTVYPPTAPTTVYAPTPGYPTTGTGTGNWPGATGIQAPQVPTPTTDTGTDTTAADDANQPKVTLQKPIKVYHVLPEYIIAMLTWLGSSSTKTTGTGTGTLNNTGQFGMGGQTIGGMNGQTGGLNLPPTESSILAQELQTGANEQMAIGSIAQQGSSSAGGVYGSGGMGGYGSSGYGGGYGNTGGYGGGYGSSGYGGGYGNTGGYGGGYYGR